MPLPHCNGARARRTVAVQRGLRTRSHLGEEARGAALVRAQRARPCADPWCDDASAGAGRVMQSEVASFERRSPVAPHGCRPRARRRKGVIAEPRAACRAPSKSLATMAMAMAERLGRPGFMPRHTAPGPRSTSRKRSRPWCRRLTKARSRPQPAWWFPAASARSSGVGWRRPR